MINLNKIDKNIDEALDKETPESLTKWLLDHRKSQAQIMDDQNDDGCGSAAWIKVSDRLPNDGDEVIFGANDIVDMQQRLCKPMVSAGFFMAGNFHSWLSRDKLKATHWMPLPILMNGD